MKLKLVSLLSAIVLLAACGSGSDGGATVSESSLAIDVTNAPKGPASYVHYQNIHQPEVVQNQLNSFLIEQQKKQFSAISSSSSQVNATNSSSNPISIPYSCSKQPTLSWSGLAGAASSGLSIISHLVPEIGVLGSMIGLGESIYNTAESGQGSGPSACISNTIAEINTEFNKVLGKIQNIEDTLELRDTFLYEEIVNQAQSSLTLAYQNYRQKIERVVGSEDGNIQGSYSRFIYETKLAETPDTSLTEVAYSRNRLGLASLELLINGYDIQDSFFDLSGAWYNRDLCAQNPKQCVSSIKAASLDNGYSQSDLIQVMYEAKQVLFAKIAETLQQNSDAVSRGDITSQQNIVELFQDYNKFIASLYHQSLVAITADYYLLLTANQINALSISHSNYSDPYAIFMPDAADIPGAYFFPSQAAGTSSSDISKAANTNKTNFDQAQQYLNTFYAGIINQLYQNIVSYMVTDYPVPQQLTSDESNGWDKGKYEYNAQPTGYSMPKDTSVDGYSCWVASQGATSTANGNSQWTAANLDYDTCKSKMQASGNVISAEHFNYCLATPSYVVTTGCYKWAQGADKQAYSFAAIPKGATLIYGNSSTVSIENLVEYDKIVATNAFQPANNPVPTLGDDRVAGNPYFTMPNATSSVIYQTPLLKGINTCFENYIKAVQAQVSLNDFTSNLDLNCPAIFPELKDDNGNVQIATVTGVPSVENFSAILAPMHIDSSVSPAKQELYGKMYGVTDACISNDELVTYTPSIDGTIAEVDTHYLTCRIWKTSDEFRNEAAIGNAWNFSTDDGRYEYNAAEESKDSWGNWTPLLPPRPSSGSSLPAYGDFYFTDASWLATPAYESNDSGNAYPYFTESAGALKTVEFSGNGKYTSFPQDRYPWAGNMPHDYKGNQATTIHMLATSLEVDGFYYPLVYQFWNRNDNPGNGFGVVQNNIVNNVGFITASTDANGNKVFSATSLAQDFPFVTSPYGSKSVTGGDKAVSDLSYANTEQTPDGGAFTKMNNIIFWFGDMNNTSNLTSAGNKGAYWNNNSLYVTYLLANEFVPYIDR